MSFKGFPYYWGAIATTKCIKAIVFVFLPGKAADQVKLDACTGWVRHMGRFYENRICFINCSLSVLCQLGSIVHSHFKKLGYIANRMAWIQALYRNFVLFYESCKTFIMIGTKTNALRGYSIWNR